MAFNGKASTDDLMQGNDYSIQKES
jgi:MATE family multidrug resistance protein